MPRSMNRWQPGPPVREAPLQPGWNEELATMQQSTANKNISKPPQVTDASAAPGLNK